MNVPLILNEASIQLYRADSSGDAIVSESVWAGAYAENLRITKRFNTHSYYPTGASISVRRHEGTQYDISIGRIWFVQSSDGMDFDPEPNEKFVMIIVWQDVTKTYLWHRRTYYGVMCDSVEASSNGIMEFLDDQTFTAESEAREAGNTTAGVKYAGYPTPTLPTVGAEIFESYIFMHEGAMIDNDYLMGHYSWTENIQLSSASVYARAPQSSDSVVALEVDGVLTGDTITITAGTEHSIVSASCSLAVDVTAGQVVRWKCTSAPSDSEDCSYEVGLVMKVKETS